MNARTSIGPFMSLRDFGIRAILVTAVLFVVVACGSSVDGSKDYPPYRYRLIVEVDTPEGLKTGSSVIEVRTRRTGKHNIPSPGALAYDVRGEAVTVDLGKRGVMFALLRSEALNDWAAGAFEALAPATPYNVAIKLDDEYGYRRAKALALRGPQQLPRHFDPGTSQGPAQSDPPTAYPMLVRFRDLADPKTVEKVEADNLATTFGPGVVLERITLERTEDAVTTGIERWLGWLSVQAGGLIKIPRDMPIGNAPFGASIIEGDFQKGLTK